MKSANVDEPVTTIDQTLQEAAMDLSTRLRTATANLHTQVENLLLAQAMISGTIAREDYIELLQQLLIAHRGWEASASIDLAAMKLWDPSIERSEVLKQDLAALGANPGSSVDPAIETWLTQTREIAQNEPEVWLGVIYLFEGSRMGSMALVRPLSRALGLEPAPGCGLDYHLDGIADRVPRWRRFQAMLNTLPFSPEAQTAVVSGAVSAFQMLHDVYAGVEAVALPVGG